MDKDLEHFCSVPGGCETCRPHLEAEQAQRDAGLPVQTNTQVDPAYEFIVHACRYAGYDIDMDEFDFVLAHEHSLVGKLVETCAMVLAGDMLLGRQRSIMLTIKDSGDADLIGENRYRLLEIQDSMPRLIRDVAKACENITRCLALGIEPHRVGLVYPIDDPAKCPDCNSLYVNERNIKSYGGTSETFLHCELCNKSFNMGADLSAIL